MARLSSATGDAIVRLEESGRAWTVAVGLAGSGAQCVAVDPDDPDTVYAGLREGGVRRSVDGGGSWVDCALPEAAVFSLAVSRADGAVYAGTEPSRLFCSDDRGRAYEAGGGGAALRFDAGETWQPADEGRDRHYTWSVTVDHRDPDYWYISASTGPYAAHGGRDPQARIFRRRGGESWQALAGGLPQPLPAMPYALLAADGRLFAGLGDGQLWESRDRGDTWTLCRLEGDPLRRFVALASADG